MYCPKCKQTFEEGSRRFCPTDGRRLISDETPEPAAGRGGGVFSTLLPLAEIDRESRETSEAPANPASKPPESQPEAPFFEIGDDEPEFSDDTEFTIPVDESPGAPGRTARKVNPFAIPAGHVEIEENEGAKARNYDIDDPETFVGKTVKGRYQVTEFLGGDETGLAYLADDQILSGKKVLVRVLADNEPDEVMRSILAEERVSLSHFSHPNVARLIDSGEFSDGRKFLITEYVDSLSVRDILDIHGRVDTARTARSIRQAASALSEAHQQGIIHRHVRPENIILLAPEGSPEQVKLVNFGASNGEPTPHNAAYKAPEVLDGRIATVSADIFSLAVAAYEMLTGKLPFRGKSTKEIVRSQYEGITELPSTLRPNLPPEVDDVLIRALSFNVAERFTKAREFGDAFFMTLTQAPRSPVAAVPVAEPEVPRKTEFKPLPPIVPPIPAEKVAPEKADTRAKGLSAAELAMTNERSKSPADQRSRTTLIVVGVVALLLLAVLGWYYFVYRPQSQSPNQAAMTSANNNGSAPVQPPNSEAYQNNKQNLKGDLLQHFVGFSLYYPKDWKVNGPQTSASRNTRGKFLDISRQTPDGRLKEQMLISYYPSKGTYRDDADRFPQMVKETNETLKKLIPSYQMVSEGQTTVNGDWPAYEIKFQGGGTSPNGEKLIVWGRRLFIPAEHPGANDGFEITMLATSLADNVHSVDDVGVRGELAPILSSFEPTQNY